MEGKPTATGTVEARPEMEAALTGRSTRVGEERAGAERIVDHLPAGVVEVDAEGRLLRVNAAFCRLTGYAPEELLGRSIDDIAAPPEAIDQLGDLLHRGGADRFQLGCIRRDGTLLRGRVTAAVIPDAAHGAPSLLLLVEDADGTLPEPAPLAPRIDAVEVVCGAVAQAREAAYARDLDIAYAYAAAPVWVRVDGEQLRRSVDDLLAGVVRSTPRGSVAVRCTAQDGEALLEVLEVRDPSAAGANLDAAFATAPAATESGGRVTMRLPLARA